MREARSGSALVAAVMSAQDSRALRRLSRSCLAVRERRCTGASSSSGSLHTSRGVCTVWRRRDTGGDVSRDTSDSNIAARYPLRYFEDRSHADLTPHSHPIIRYSSTYPLTSNAYNQRLFCNHAASEQHVVLYLACCTCDDIRSQSNAIRNLDRWPIRAGIVTDSGHAQNGIVWNSFTQTTHRDERKRQKRSHLHQNIVQQNALVHINNKIIAQITNNGCWKRPSVLFHTFRGICRRFINLVTELI